MTVAMVTQHVVAIGAAAAAAGWLVARTRGKKRAAGPCASCAASAHLRTAKRPEASPSRVAILKK